MLGREPVGPGNARARRHPLRRRRRRGHTAGPSICALGAVLSEIDEIAKATFSSITLATMLRLIERHRNGRRRQGI